MPCAPRKSPFGENPSVILGFKNALSCPHEESECLIQEKSACAEWGVALEAGMRDVAEVICEPKVFQQTITKPCGPRSTISPCPFLQPPRNGPCPILQRMVLGRDIQPGASQEEKKAESGIPNQPPSQSILVVPAGSHRAKHFSRSPRVVSVTMQGRKNIYGELSNRQGWDYEACLDIFRV